MKPRNVAFFRLMLLFLWIYPSCSDASTDISELKEICSIDPINQRKIRAKCSGDSFFRLLPAIYSNDLEILEVEGIQTDFMPKDIILPPTLHRLRLYHFDASYIDLKWLNISGNLLHLEIHDSQAIFSWRYSGETFDQLTHLVIENSLLYLLRSDLRFLSSLKFLEVRNSEVYWIHQDALRKSKELRLLCLSGNKLNHFSRNYLPIPAPHLWHLDLSYNRIQILPKYLFSGMPRLREVRLDHNLLKTFPDLSGLHTHLKELWIQDNNLCSPYYNDSCYQNLD